MSTAFVLCMVFEPQDSFIKIDSLSFELRKLVIFGKNKKEKKISNTIQQWIHLGFSIFDAWLFKWGDRS